MKTPNWRRIAYLTALSALGMATTAVAQPPDVLVHLSVEGGLPLTKLLAANDGQLYGTTCLGGTYGKGSVFKVDQTGQQFTPLHAFNGSDGECPAGELIQGVDGFLYGTTLSGGAVVGLAAGTIFRIPTAPGSGLETLYTFTAPTVPIGTMPPWPNGAIPRAGLIESGGFLFGTTSSGGIAADGTEGGGTVFRVDVTTNPVTVTVLHVFDDRTAGEGALPTMALVEANGVLFGTTERGGAAGSGTIFRIDANTGSVVGDTVNGSNYRALQVVPDQQGSLPLDGPHGLVRLGNLLYGVTHQGVDCSVTTKCGLLFSVDVGTEQYALIDALPSFIVGPVAPLVVVNGALYGTAPGGGANGDGVIFRVDTLTNEVTPFHDFDRRVDGSEPVAGLIELGGVLYGTTSWYGSDSPEGPGGAGMVFGVSIATGQSIPVHRFGPIQPNRPLAELTLSQGTLYGTASRGGLNDSGAVFTVDVNGSSIDILHNFIVANARGPQGLNPQGAVVVGPDGALYGTAPMGGAHDAGVVFKMNRDGSQFEVVHSFDATTNPPGGAGPYAKLLPVGNVLYGTTAGGGEHGAGTVFSVTLGGQVDILHSFGSTPDDGAMPIGPVIQSARDGWLYGTTKFGGANRDAAHPTGGGTVFRLDPSSHAVEVLHSFGFQDASNASMPVSALVEDVPGVFYGAAPDNGAVAGGIVFALDATVQPPAFRSLHTFENIFLTPLGSHPTGALVKGAGGWFYGTTARGGPDESGTAFAINRAGDIRLIATFDSAHGSRPMSALTLMDDGSFYGTTSEGGQGAGGTIFRITADTDADSVRDGRDNCPLVANLNQVDGDGDGIGDACTAMPAIQLSNSTIDFGSVSIGASATASVRLTSMGAGPLIVTAITTTAGGVFTASRACEQSFDPLAFCDIQVSFAPTTAGPVHGELTIDSNAPGHPHRVSVDGRGVGAPVVTLSPTSLTFANQLLGTSSAPQDVTVTNDGNDSLVLGTFGIVGSDFQITSSSCVAGSTIAPHSSCTIGVTHAPTTAPGFHQAQLQIGSNAPGQPHTVPLTGFGDARAISLTPALVDFHAHAVESTAPTQRITIANTGTLPVALGSLTLAGDTSAGVISTFAGLPDGGSQGDGIPATTADITPVSLALDSVSNLFVVDALSGRVRRIDAATHLITTVWTPLSLVDVDDGVMTMSATHVAVDRNDNLYVAEQTRVRRVDASTGRISTIAGTGQEGSSGDGGPASAALFHENGIALDAQGNLFIADGLSNTIRRVDAVTGLITRAAGNGPIHPSSGDGGPATAAGLNGVFGVAVDAAGNLLIRESPSGQGDQHTTGIRRVDGRSGIIETVGAPGSPIDWGPDIAVDAYGNVYVVSSFGSGGAIWRLDRGTGLPTRMAGGSSGSGGDGDPATQVTLSTPFAVTVDQGGHIYIAESGARRVRRVGGVSTSASLVFPVTTDCGATLNVGGACHADVAFTPPAAGPHTASLIVAADDGLPPHVAAVAGLGTRAVEYLWPDDLDFGSQTIAARSTQDVMIANSGNAVLDVAAAQIVGAAMADFTISGTTCASSLAPGMSCRTTVTFTPSAAGTRSASLRVDSNDPTNAGLVGLTGIGVARTISVTPSILAFGDQRLNLATAAQRVTISNTGTVDVQLGQVAINGGAAGDYSRTGTCLDVLPGGDTCVIDVVFTPHAVGSRIATLVVPNDASGNPHHVALSGNGTATAVVTLSPSVIDFGRVSIDGSTVHSAVTLANNGTTPFAVPALQMHGKTTTAGHLGTIGGGGTPGSDGEGGPATSANLGDVFAVVVDASGNLYLSDATHHRIRRIDAITSAITTVAGNGTAGYSGDGGSALIASLNGPTGLALDASGALYVADTANHVVRRISAAGTITTVAGTAIAGYSGDGAQATAAMLHAPIGLAVDLSGNLFIADSRNHAIRRVASDGTIATLLGNGQPGNGLGSDAFDPVRLNGPQAVAVDAAGSLYITDTGNARVVRLDPNGNLTWLIRGANQTVRAIGEPAGIAVDAFGRIFVAETENHRVRLLDPGAPGFQGYPIVVADAMPTIAGTGVPGFADDTAAFPGQLTFPRGLAVDVAGNVYIADQGNHRVRLIDGVTVPALEFGATSGCGQSLGPGMSCEIDVAFSPRAASRRNASLSMGALTVDLTGFGTLPVAYISSVELVAVGGGPQAPVWNVAAGLTDTKTLGVINSGNGTLHVSSVLLTFAGGGTGPFSATADCAAPVPPGGRCDIHVTFAPTAVEPASATLAVVHDGRPSPHDIRVRATGTRAVTTTTLTSTSPQNHSIFGESVTLNVSVSSPSLTPTGQVSLTDSVFLLPPLPPALTLNAAGTATLTFAALPAGSHAFKADYTGAVLHLPSSSTLTQIVDRQVTSMTLVASRVASTYGQPIVFTATITAITNGPLAGRVRFQDGARQLGTVAVSGQTAAITLTDLTTGAHDVTATYENDPNSLSSTAGPSRATVSKVATTTTIAFSPNPAYVNNPFTVTATIAPLVGAGPTGTVTFRNQANQIVGTANVASGTATLTLTVAAQQNVTLRAAYSGDANFNASNGGPASVQVRKVPTTLAITSSQNPSFVGDAVTLTITMTTPVGPPPDGTPMTLFAPAQVPLTLRNGAATYTTSTLPVGARSITAVYSGDATFLADTASHIQTVQKRGTTTVLTSSSNPSTFGKPVTFTVTVTSPDGPPPPDGETVTLIVGNQTLHPRLTGGVATFTTSSLAGGDTRVQARYPGNAAYAISPLVTVTQLVNPATTHVTLTSAPNPSARRAQVPFTIAVASSVATPNGAVTLKVGNSVVGTRTLTNGSATITYAFPTVGTFIVTATYQGNADFAMGMAQLTQTVR